MCINQYNTIFSLMQIVNISDENNGKDFIQGCNIINWIVVGHFRIPILIKNFSIHLLIVDDGKLTPNHIYSSS